MLDNTSSFSVKDYFACIVIFIVPLWHPLSQWILHFDIARRIPLALLIIALLLLAKDIRNRVLKQHFIVYFLLALWMYINGIVQGGYLNYGNNVANGKYVMFVYLFCPLMYMTLVAYLSVVDFDKVLKWVTWSLFLYCVLCLFFGEFDEQGRLGGGLNANGIATYGNFCFFCLLLQFMQGQRSLQSLIVFSIIPVYLIVFSGSRIAFGLLASAAILAAFLFYRNRKWSGSVLLYVLIAIVLIVGITYVMNNTVVGERLRETSTQVEGMEVETGTVLDMLGDRGPQYYWSWPYFLEHPIRGIGLNNWRVVGNTGLVFHSEWLVLYCENGIVALALYLLFYISLLIGLFSALRTCYVDDKESLILLVFVLFAIAMLNFVSWTYDTFCVFAFYAFASAYPQREELDDEETEDCCEDEEMIEDEEMLLS